MARTAPWKATALGLAVVACGVLGTTFAFAEGREAAVAGAPAAVSRPAVQEPAVADPAPSRPLQIAPQPAPEPVPASDDDLDDDDN